MLIDCLQQSGYCVQAPAAVQLLINNIAGISGFIVDEGAARRHGKELLRHKADTSMPFMPLLILLSHKNSYEQWLQAGFDDVLRYPLAKAELLARLRVFMKLREQSQQIHEVNQLKDQFLATVSHELRTPLTAMLGWTRMLRSGKLDEATAARALEIIERNITTQSQLIEDLLDISRIASGKLYLDIQPVDLVAVVDAAINAIHPSAEAKGVRVKALIAPEMELISGDLIRLQQVVLNLLSNAIKFTPRGGEVVVSIEQSQSHTSITVYDNGEGIKADFLPHVFERFRQGEGSTNRKHCGLGLGLAIVKQLVELHGGTITAYSAGEGQGATFTVTLPLKKEGVEAVRRAALKERLEDGLSTDYADRLEGLNVLIVDDDADSRTMLALLLNQHGVTVQPAASADEALAILEQWKPDIIISDIGMPEKDGYQFIQELRARRAEQGGLVPAVALTAFARAEDRLRVLAAGYVTHIAKPVEPAELVAVIASVTGLTDYTASVSVKTNKGHGNQV